MYIYALDALLALLVLGLVLMSHVGIQRIVQPEQRLAHRFAGPDHRFENSNRDSSDDRPHRALQNTTIN